MFFLLRGGNIPFIAIAFDFCHRARWRPWHWQHTTEARAWQLAHNGDLEWMVENMIESSGISH